MVHSISYFLTAAKDWVQPVAILIGGIWIAGIWVHANLYLPSQQGQFISIAPSATALDKNTILLRITIDNTSTVRAYNVSHYVAIYSLIWREGVSNPISNEQIQSAARTVQGSSETFLSLGHVASKELVGFSAFHAPYNYYEPGESQNYERLIFLDNFVP